MTKHDSIEWVPEPLRKLKWNVLSTSRSSYAIGGFDVFRQLPDASGIRPEFFEFPDFETLDIEHITSESNAINALSISGILNKFLGTENLVETFNGRMGTGEFDFRINGNDGRPISLAVKNAQLEIDGGFESDDCVVILEAKNVLHDDFNVRQLYYPYRKYHEFVKKPIRLVFSQYTNLRYNLYEVRFKDVDDFNSLVVVNVASYTFKDDKITADDIQSVWCKTDVLFDDNVDHIHGARIPFPQADKVERIFSVLEFLYANPEGATSAQIANHMEVTGRQGNYYPSAALYLGLIERDEDHLLKLSRRAQTLLKGDRKTRLLGVVSAMFEHAVFHQLYEETVKNGEIPSKSRVIEVMRQYNVIKENRDSKGTMIPRRASTVLGWLRWMLEELPDGE